MYITCVYKYLTWTPRYFGNKGMYMNVYVYNTEMHGVKDIVAWHYDEMLWSQGCNLIRNTRREMYGDDKWGAIELKYGNGTKAESFLMFSLYWCDKDGPQWILGFALPSLIKLLEYKKLFLHIDATLDGAPPGFHQDIIFSVLDHTSSLHTPIFYCPMTKKSEEAYNLLWGNIYSIVGESRFVKLVICMVHLCNEVWLGTLHICNNECQGPRV